MNLQELSKIEQAIKKSLTKSSATWFQFYINKGWFVLSNKTVDNHNGVILENFKNAEDFGKHFAKTIEVDTDKFFSSLKEGLVPKEKEKM